MKHDILSDVNGALEKIAMLRDEVRLHLHLASLDAKQEWQDTLEPKVLELQHEAKTLGADVRDAAVDVVTKLEAFAGRLRDAALAKKAS